MITLVGVSKAKNLVLHLLPLISKSTLINRGRTTIQNEGPHNCIKVIILATQRLFQCMYIISCPQQWWGMDLNEFLFTYSRCVAIYM